MSMWFSHNGISVPRAETQLTPTPRSMASQVLSTATTRAAISMHGSQSRTEAETAAFGYRARALVFNSGSEKE